MLHVAAYLQDGLAKDAGRPSDCGIVVLAVELLARRGVDHSELPDVGQQS